MALEKEEIKNLKKNFGALNIVFKRKLDYFELSLASLSYMWILGLEPNLWLRIFFCNMTVKWNELYWFVSNVIEMRSNNERLSGKTVVMLLPSLLHSI